MNKVICRKNEIDIINNRLKSDTTEFIVDYGRRRVGKTWLVRNSIPMLLDKESYVYLEITGTINDDLRSAPTKESFYNSLNLSWNISFGETLFDPYSDNRSINIENIFFLKLSEKLHSLGNKGIKLIVFFDELPWIAKTSRTFYDGILFFRNNAVRDNPNMKIFVSGSSTSWMLDNIINAKGSAALRATELIKLSPFSLADTKHYLEKKCKLFCNNEIVFDIYLCIGGIPYYLDYISPQKSWAENI
ncbi:ATPase, partial [Candidatus Magnetomorum sp. HK-1]